MKAVLFFVLCGLAAAAEGTTDPKLEEARELKACAQMVLAGFRKIPDSRAQRFLGKVRMTKCFAAEARKAFNFG